MAQRLTTICDFCISEDRSAPNVGKFQAEITAEGTNLVADLCDEHMGMLATGFHPRRGRAPAWLLELQGKEEKPKQKRKYTKRQQPLEAETPEEPGDPDEAEPEDDDAEGDEPEGDEEVAPEAIAV